jgi:hypothetical protein
MLGEGGRGIKGNKNPQKRGKDSKKRKHKKKDE